MKNTTIAGLVLGLGTLINASAMATVPDMIPVQGILADASDEPIDDLTDISFTLYDDEAGTTVLWTDTFLDVDVVDGFFTVYLGSNTALDFASLLSNAEVWMGIAVETDSEMDRFPLATVPFAVEAQVCQAVGSLSEADINSNFMSSSYTPSWTDLTDIPAGFDDDTDDVNDTVDWSEISGIVGTTVSTVAEGSHNHDGVYLTSFTESDPVFLTSTAYGIDATDVTNWDAAYGWGDHAGLYSLDDHLHDDDYVNVTGDTMTGDLTVQANVMGGIGHEVDTTVDNYFFGGGSYNEIRNDGTELSAIASGRGNFIGLECTERCVDGDNCPLENPDECIVEGGSNSSPYSFIGAGRSNTINNDYGFIGSGRLNHISRLYGFIGGGRENVIKDDRSVIVGGRDNMINEYGEYGFIGGGYNNYIRSYNPSDMYNTLAGGFINSIQMSYEAFIGGGSWNYIGYGPFSTISGGQRNVSYEKGTTIAGGRYNRIVGEYNTIGGGLGNRVDGYSYYSTIVGGVGNRIYSSNNSVVMGSGARAWHDGCFVWSDGFVTDSSAIFDATYGWGYPARSGSPKETTGTDPDPSAPDIEDALDGIVDTTTANQFIARARGGFVFYTAGTGTTTGAQLPAGSGSWSSLSDRNAKENVVEIDTGEVLERVCDMQINTWNYITQDDSIRHAGPMAQDFYAAFELGEDERRLSNVDMDGIALAAIKGLKEQKDAEITELKETIELLVKRIEDLEER